MNLAVMDGDVEKIVHAVRVQWEAGLAFGL